jgi:hypothetical protein
MARMEPIAVEQAPAKARELLDELAARGGEPGPMAQSMANAPALLRGYLDLNRAMKRSHLDRRVSERVSLVDVSASVAVFRRPARGAEVGG